MASILIVEDRPTDRKLLATVLTSGGHEVVEAADGADALRALRRDRPDLVISDILMPAIDGYELVRQIRDIPNVKDVPVVFYTASFHEREAQALAARWGVAAILTKPSPPSAILNTVGSVLGSTMEPVVPPDRARFDREHPEVVSSMLAERVKALEAREERIADAYAAVAAENAQLYDEARRHADVLKEERERTEFALAAAGTGIWEIDLIEGRVTWSDSLAPLFGLTPAQAPTTHGEFFERIHPEDRRAFDDSLERATIERPELSVEFRALWPDGTLHWNAGRARVMFDGDGHPIKLLGVAIDIAHQKLLEEQFRQAQKMEAVGQLAGGVAHDFNNLLTAVLGNANLLQEEPNLTPTVRDEITEIVKAAERAASLTRQLLAFGRKQVLQPTIVDVNALVADMGHMLRRLIGEHIQLATSLAPSLAPVRADAGQLEQVILNLAINARDAMPTGGRLSIETANVELDESYAMSHVAVRPGKYVMLAVSDTGIGMDEETKTHLFEPFFTTKDRTKGTGLGLATVYGIIKQSNGYIWVYSEKGHGSSFKVYLPVATRAAVVERPGPSPAQPTRGTERVLVVEDDAAVRQLTRILLEKAGYRVLVAANAQEAADLFQRHGDSISLLITDVVMPGPSGPALLRHLSEQRPGLKVLYMSGYADDAVPAHGALNTGDVFLQKPFTADRLVRKVREALER